MTDPTTIARCRAQADELLTAVLAEVETQVAPCTLLCHWRVQRLLVERLSAVLTDSEEKRIELRDMVSSSEQRRPFPIAGDMPSLDDMRLRLHRAIGHSWANTTVIELEACNLAADMIKAAGFEFRYASFRSEACYYGWPERTTLLRIAAHSHDKGVNGLGKIVSRLTLNSQSIKFKSPDTMERIIALAIGHYFLRS